MKSSRKCAVRIIAELCQNHKGDIDLMKEMVHDAAKAGATYAKIQSMFADDLSFRERFETGEVRNGKIITIKRPYQPEYERLKPMDLDFEAHSIFIKECEKYGIKPLTTVFARCRIPFVAKFPWREIKVASYDCGSFPMIRELKERFEHLYISTGATYDYEIEKTAQILKDHRYTFLHCVTIYPTPLNFLNLARMNYLRRYAPEVGLSEHTLVKRDGIKASIVALMFGADVIERHFTILDEHETKDGPVSINPEQLRELVEFSKMDTDEIETYVKKEIPEYKEMIGVEKSELTHDELLNRDYYRGRFASKINGEIIYNYENKKIF
jgi:N,N'-diacetyllegionaminate synthase